MLSRGELELEMGQKREENLKPREPTIIYGVVDVPPWYSCIFFAFQHYMILMASTIAVPHIVGNAVCQADDLLGRSQLICTQMFVNGVTTLIQSTFGTRLPIVQGVSGSFLPPLFAIMSLPQWQCPETPAVYQNVSQDVLPPGVELTYMEWRRDVWTTRMREIQGAICMAAIFQVLVGLTGVIGFLLRFIGPLTVAPVVVLIGLSLQKVVTGVADNHWGIAIFTIVLIAVFSLYLGNVRIPVPKYSRQGGWSRVRVKFFAVLPVFLSVVIVWGLCGILTVTDVVPNNSTSPHYGIRTDTRNYVLDQAQWFRFPYPGQWGLPTFSAAAVLGMAAAVIASILESIGDYYACALLMGAPPPPPHAINRGVLFEGIGCIIAGLCGTGNGVTSHSDNIGALGLTKVGSRRIIQVAAVLSILFGVIAKVGAFFVTIPVAILGGIYIILFGMLMAVGVSNLQYVDLNSSRNLFIFGFATFFGFSLPEWLNGKPGVISTGNSTADQVFTVLLGTPMFVGGVIGFFLDNTVPGTREERGLTKWIPSDNKENQEMKDRVYGFPFGMSYLKKSSWAKYVPICPPFRPSCGRASEPGEGHLEELAGLEDQGIMERTQATQSDTNGVYSYVGMSGSTSKNDQSDSNVYVSRS